MQEAGLLFYSYIILQRLLRRARWRIFSSLFWLMMLVILVTRIVVAIFRVRSILEDDFGLQMAINYLHTAYFSSVAILECISAYFLVGVFASAANASRQAALRVGLFSYFTRSTEVRVAILAILGVMRVITRSLRNPGQQADNLASQVDRFTYCLICLYPVVL